MMLVGGKEEAEPAAVKGTAPALSEEPEAVVAAEATEEAGTYPWSD